jgi:hypothetical protein
MPLGGRVGRHTRQGGGQAQNWPDDQLTIINLLNNISPADGGAGASLSKSVRSGICSDELYRAISTFEDKQFPGQRNGYVDPGGAMLKRMEALAAKTAAPIRFVTPEEWLGPPTGKTRDISNTRIPLSSIDVVWVGLTGDSQNIVKTVAANIPGAVTIAEANTANNIRWFRLTKLPGQGTEAQVRAKDGTGKVVVSFDLSLIDLAKGPGTLDTELGPDGTIVYLAPKARADYIDNRAEAIGYYIYHPSFQVYCSGMSGPIYVSDDFLKLDVEKAEAINSTIYDTLAEAKDAIKQAPAKTKGVTPFAYFKGAAGAVIAPTIFSPATTPRIIAGYYGARRVWAQNVASELTGVSIGLGTGIAFRMTLGRTYRPLPEDPKPPPRNLPPPVPPKIRPVNDTVNVGGGGEIPNVTNLNPIKPFSGGPTSGIPNHVPAGMEKMDEIFVPGSVKNMYSNRLRYGDVDWTRGTRAAANVMPPGGKVRMNIWTENQKDMDALKAAFERAGFKNVRFGYQNIPETSSPGAGTILQAERAWTW